jgi:hypothetical protein
MSLKHSQPPEPESSRLAWNDNLGRPIWDCSDLSELSSCEARFAEFAGKGLFLEHSPIYHQTRKSLNLSMARRINTSVKQFTLPMLVLLAAFAHADLAGKWKGTVKTETPGIELGGIQTQTPKIDLVIKADGTYVQNSSNPDGTTKRTEGTWKQDKNIVFFTAVKQDGKPVSKEVAMPKKYTLNEKGKAMSRDISADVKKKMQGNTDHQEQMDQILSKMIVTLTFEKQ